MSKRKTNKMLGSGLFSNVWNGMKKGVSYAKKYKIPSAALSLASIFQPELAGAAATASALGFGKLKIPDDCEYGKKVREQRQKYYYNRKEKNKGSKKTRKTKKTKK